MDLDQFYTDTAVADRCLKTFEKVIRDKTQINSDDYWYIEPSAGCGSFYQWLPADRRIGMDIAPTVMPFGEPSGIEQADFLKWEPPTGGCRYIVVGNPPFGFRCDAALRFINHSAKFADAIGMILPPQFESDGKGVARKRVRSDLTLIHSERLPADSFITPENERKEIHTVFQVWVKAHSIPEQDDLKSCSRFVSLYSVSDGGTPGSTRNKRMIGKCHVYLPITCFEGRMKAYLDFEELPYRKGYGVVVHDNNESLKDYLLSLDWSERAFRSTNSALNLRFSIIKQAIIEGGFYERDERLRLAI